MQKETSNPIGLYTAVFEYDKSLFIHQFHEQENNLKSLLYKWGRIAMHKKMIANKEDKKLLIEILFVDEDKIHRLVSVNNTKNAWWTFFTLSKGSVTLQIVKTAQEDLGVTSYKKQGIWKKYALYQREYEQLKDILITTQAVRKAKRKYERLMRYWAQKKLAASTHLGDDQGLYTIAEVYEGDVFGYQFSVSIDEDINNILKRWPEKLKEANAFRDAYNYKIITQRAHSEAYQLRSVTGLVNVWSTYFALRDGFADIFVIKTDTAVTITEKK